MKNVRYFYQWAPFLWVAFIEDISGDSSGFLKGIRSSARKRVILAPLLSISPLPYLPGSRRGGWPFFLIFPFLRKWKFFCPPESVSIIDNVYWIGKYPDFIFVKRLLLLSADPFCGLHLLRAFLLTRLGSSKISGGEKDSFLRLNVRYFCL